MSRGPHLQAPLCPCLQGLGEEAQTRVHNSTPMNTKAPQIPPSQQQTRIFCTLVSTPDFHPHLPPLFTACWGPSLPPGAPVRMDFVKSLRGLETHVQSCCACVFLFWIDMLSSTGMGLQEWAAWTVQRGGEGDTTAVLSKGAREKKRDTPSRPPLAPHRVPPPDLLALFLCLLAFLLSHPFFLINLKSIHTVWSST